MAKGQGDLAQPRGRRIRALVILAQPSSGPVYSRDFLFSAMVCICGVLVAAVSPKTRKPGHKNPRRPVLREDSPCGPMWVDVGSPCGDVQSQHYLFPMWPSPFDRLTTAGSVKSSRSMPRELWPFWPTPATWCYT